MYVTTIPGLVRWFLPRNLVWKIPTDRKELFLTFDDGPIPEVTPLVLDLLDEYEARATFFCVGDNVRKHPDVYNEVLSRGHAVGNHTFNHLQGWKTGLEEYYLNVDKCRELVDSHLFRPPHGQVTPKIARDLGKQYKLIMWSVLTRDYDRELNPDKCLQISLKGIFPGSVIVFHDSLKARRNMEYALPRFLEESKRRGYTFSVIR